MQPERKSKWIKVATFALVLLSTLACTVLGWDLTGTTSSPVEVTRIVRETVIVPGADTVITSAPVVIEVTCRPFVGRHRHDGPDALPTPQNEVTHHVVHPPLNLTRRVVLTLAVDESRKLFLNRALVLL